MSDLPHDLVQCTLEQVSLGETIPEYRLYRSTYASSMTWGQLVHSLAGPPIFPTAPQILTSTSRHLFHIHRYVWGDFEALSYPWGEDRVSGKFSFMALSSLFPRT